MKDSIKNIVNSPVFLGYLVIFVSLYLEYFIFQQFLGGMGAKWYVTCFKCFGDLLFLTSFYWLLPNRKKWILLILQWLISFFMITNTWHYKAWNQFISPTAYKLTDNLNSVLFESIKGLVSVFDIVYIIIPLISTLIYFCLIKKRLYNLPAFILKIKLMLVGISFLFFLLAQTAFIITTRRQDIADLSYYRESLGKEIINRLNPIERTATAGELLQEGFVLHFYRSFGEVIHDLFTKSSVKLSQDDLNTITDYIDDTPFPPTIDTLLSNNSKNLVIILVESLNSYVIDRKINGHPLTPVMNSLVQAQGSVVSLNMRPQIQDGISNDGQLITNTGLLPLSKGIAMWEFGSKNTFPSIPKTLHNYSNAVIFGDNGFTWGEILSFKSFGFNTILTESDFKQRAEEVGNDQAMFEYGEKIINTLGQPFLLEFVTISTHVPFRDNGVEIPEWISKDNSLDSHELNYFAMVNYFDTQLGNFIHFLKNENLWNNTVLVVTSDHSLSLAVGKMDNPTGKKIEFTDIPCVFIAANTGVTKTIETPTAQINVFPTLLHIMGATPQSGYRGLDRSMLDPELKSAVDSKGDVYGNPSETDLVRQKKAVEISNLILRGDYFGRKAEQAPRVRPDIKPRSIEQIKHR